MKIELVIHAVGLVSALATFLAGIVLKNIGISISGVLTGISTIYSFVKTIRGK